MAYDHASDYLQLAWFSEIPRCLSDCFYPQALDRGCVYTDFSCICLAIADLAPGPEARACIEACPVQPDQRWASSQILGFCDLIGESIQLPEYLNQVPRMHRRQYDDDDSDYYYSLYYATHVFSESSTSTAEDYSYFTYSSDDLYLSPTPTSDVYDTTTTAELYDFPTISTDSAEVDTQPAAMPATATASQTSSPTSETSSSGAKGNAAATSGPASSGLSTGAKAGIAVGVAVPLIILCLFIFWYIRKRKRNRRSSEISVGNDNGIPEHDGNEKAAAVGSISALPDNPIGAHGKTIHESGGRSIVPSKSLNFETPGPAVYELSGKSAMNRPPPVVDSLFIGNDSTDNQVDTFVSRPMSYNAEMSRSSISAIETKERRSLNTSFSELAETDGASQEPHQDHRAPSQGSSTPLGTADVPLSQLEAEMALIAEEKERLQQLQCLSKREAELKRQIMARSSGR